MRTSDFDYDLPDDLIARFPLAERSASRLLHVDGTAGGWTDRRFADLPGLFRAGDLLVLNDTRVIKARLHGVKDSGGQVEVMVERVLDNHEALAFMRFSHAPRPGSRLRLADAIPATVLERRDDLFRLEFDPARTVLEWLEAHGEVPLPPYIDRPAEAEDAARYQTVYAARPGAVAAPTAGLHFDDGLLARLAALGVATARVTLHVGAGTWQPMRAETLAEHRMHSERYSIPPETVAAIRKTRERGGRVCAVGTTSLRALESAALAGDLRAGEGETDLFITPGYRFRVVDRLITNFHLPRSTLFMLVCAFGGMALMKAAYAHAVAQRYRFFSYGDASLIERADHAL
ncbi:MAG TPA: tRNA preQ1(34) S-adenosylmethionine ribosyltransferase-isomerase QueA [Thiobacillaceae bacterium]|nr:tRNA preQ1(34) S-adenosylmethionine ribosyltransferase-isomerase QueA [Thiobacillaceae bacterium]